MLSLVGFRRHLQMNVSETNMSLKQHVESKCMFRNTYITYSLFNCFLI